MKLEVTKEQLELLEFMIQEFEYQDDEERALIEGIEAQIYDVKEEDLIEEITAPAGWCIKSIDYDIQLK